MSNVGVRRLGSLLKRENIGGLTDVTASDRHRQCLVTGTAEERKPCLDDVRTYGWRGFGGACELRQNYDIEPWTSSAPADSTITWF
jgi:hypothetical protein